MKSTFTILFYIQKNRTKASGKSVIMCRITVNNKITSFSTRQEIDPKRWSTETGLTLGKTQDEKTINKTLEDLRLAVRNKYNEFIRDGKDISASVLKYAVSQSKKNRLL